MDFNTSVENVVSLFKATYVYDQIELWISELLKSENGLHMAIAVITICIALYLLTSSSIHSPRLDFPVVGDPKADDFRSALEDGAKLYPNEPFILPTAMHPTVILPTSAIDEIKALPEHQVSLRKHHYTIFIGDYTHFGTDTDELDAAIRIDLTRNVEKLLTTFQDEVAFAFDQNVLVNDDWTTLTVYPKMLRVVALLSGRVFVGLPLSRREEWIQTTCQYALDGAAGAHALTPIPRILRPVVAPFLLTSLKKHRLLARRMISPLIAKHLQISKESGSNIDDISGGDLIGYILSHYKGPVMADKIGKDQLIATFVAIHTTTICLTQAIFDLAARPEYVEPLRQELLEVFADDGIRDGKLHNTSILKLKKMDSFIKESQRVNPPGLVTMLRRVMAPDGLQLSSGHVIPAGATVGISNHAVTTSCPSPTTFDGFRFSRQREEVGHELKHQLCTTGTDSISFGHGTHACPGRFFAANEIKVILAHLLMNFDVRLREGEGRPANYHRGAIVSPPKEAVVLLRRRAI